MSCGNEKFYIKSTHYQNKWYKIPCRQCILCRIDKRKMWQERCYYEFKKLKSGAFVTFTYNDEYLFTECLRTGNDKKTRASLNYEHVSKFIENLRNYIKNHKEKQNILMQPNFKYLGVGEYGTKGEIFDRPHYHILFFGLDFKYCKKLFEEKWKMGFIDSLPILNGGINYVLKYMDKQIIGKNAIMENYKKYRLEPPKQFQSKGLGAELYYNNYEQAQKNNGIIYNGFKTIIIPQYYKNKLEISSHEKANNHQKLEYLKNYNIKLENPNKIFNQKQYDKSKLKINNEMEKINRKKLENLYHKAINNGEAVFNEYNIKLF